MQNVSILYYEELSEIFMLNSDNERVKFNIINIQCIFYKLKIAGKLRLILSRTSVFYGY